MEIKIRPIEIPKGNPFANDDLGRESEITNLTTLLVNIETPLVLALDAKWGSGKTTFVKMWVEYLASQSIISLYFNAWETDFANDPLIAFLGELNQTVLKVSGKDKGKQKIWEKTKKIGGHIAKRSIPVAVKLGTAGLLDIDKIVEDELSNLTKKVAEDAVVQYENTKNLVLQFKENLNELFKKNEGDDNKSVFVFVDELDRCRPNYALELLERIKHLLDIKNLIFVLSIDKDQLCNSVKSVYGSELDAINYLRRFIDIEYLLKLPKRDKYLLSVYNKFGFEDFFESRKAYDAFRYEKDAFWKILNILADGFNLSLREIEQFLSKMYLVVLSTKENIHLYTPLLLTLVFLKEKNRKLYNLFTEPSSTGDEVVRYFREVVPKDKRVSMYPFALLEGFIIASKKNRHEESRSEILQEMANIADNEQSNPEERDYAQRFIRIVKEPLDWRSGIVLEDLVKRFEMAEDFILKK
jgi:hypothetical protein